MTRLGQLFACATVLSSILATITAGAQEQPRIMLVLDGSSSMWTRVDGEISKIEIAKKAVADLVDDWESKMAFGITTYGHREEANCQDIETILPLADVDGKQVVDVVDSIMPKGKTPLAAALRQAADMLDYENQPAKILLVSDGIENCGQDPCQAAAELAAKAKDLSIDIIGFDMNNHQMGQLECIATNAHGHVVRADISNFSETMDHTMTAAIESEAPAVTLLLSTVMADQPVTENIRYVVHLNEAGDSSSKVAESFSAAPTLHLPTGRFEVEAIYGEGAQTQSKTMEIDLVSGEAFELVFELAEFD